MHPSMQQTGRCTRLSSIRNNCLIGWNEYDNRQHFNIFALTSDMDISKSSCYRDFEWAIELNRLTLNWIGLWPINDKVDTKKFRSDMRMGLTFITITFFFLIPLVCALMRVWGDITLMIDNLRITLPVLSVLLKFIIMRWKQSIVLSIINMIKDDWMTLKLDPERDVILKRMKTARLIIICVYILMIFAFIMVTIFPYFGLPFRRITNLTDRNKPLPFQTYYFYDTDKNPQFHLTYLTQVIIMFLIAIIYVSVDTFFGFVILHICGQLENFRRRLVNLVVGKEFNKVLRNNVVTHLRLIRYVKNAEDIFTLMMLGSIIYFSIIFCICGFALLVVINNEKINFSNFSQICYMIAAIIIFFMQMFFYCYAGELITEQWEAVYHAVCDREWYKWESKQAKNIILLMIRVQQPCGITAGKIVPLTMTTFCSLLKTSVGYISFLSAILD
ncbi:odorant receptor 10-like [Polyergus mexicanus]|uniref:odorant receptor 10-like n=1 Tax=Polyergus mexicanus TaxID=615972 RepID=UPI0038B537EF